MVFSVPIERLKYSANSLERVCELVVRDAAKAASHPDQSAFRALALFRLDTPVSICVGDLDSQHFFELRV